MAVFLVLSNPPEGVSAQEFNAWYDHHVDQILTLDGFTAAERFGLRFMRSSSGEAPPFGYLAQFETDGPFDVAWQALRKAVDVDHTLDFPEWFPQMTAAGWERLPLSGRVVARSGTNAPPPADGR